jgi:hypothetical protein
VTAITPRRPPLNYLYTRNKICDHKKRGNQERQQRKCLKDWFKEKTEIEIESGTDTVLENETNSDQQQSTSHCLTPKRAAQAGLRAAASFGPCATDATRFIFFAVFLVNRPTGDRSND